MDRRPLKSRSQAWVPVAAKYLIGAGWKPNQVSLLSVACSVAAGAAFVTARYWPFLLLLAALFIQARLVCNLLDGVMAVEGNLKSKVGDLFNDVPDRFADVIILVSAGFYLGKPALGWIAAVLAVMTAYLRLLGGSLGFPQDFSGPLAKQQRMFWMTLGSIGGCFEASVLHRVPPFLLEVALAWVAIGTAITCVRRIEKLAVALKSR